MKILIIGLLLISKIALAIHDWIVFKKNGYDPAFIPVGIKAILGISISIGLAFTILTLTPQDLLETPNDTFNIEEQQFNPDNYFN